MPIITLLTDFGLDDAYVGMLKGAIYTIRPAATIVDLSHAITAQNVRQGAYVLRTAVPYFEADTIHVAVVDPGVGTARRAILLHIAGRGYFVGPDNGLFDYVLSDNGSATRQAWALDKPVYWRQGGASHTFHGRDIFAPVAAHLAQGVAPAMLGTPFDPADLVHLDPEPISAYVSHTLNGLPQATIGRVAHIDRFGNVLTDIAASSLVGSDASRLHILVFSEESAQQRTLDITGLHSTYGETTPGTLLGLISSSGFVEIAVNAGNAAHQYGIKLGAYVAVYVSAA